MHIVFEGDKEVADGVAPSASLSPLLFKKRRTRYGNGYFFFHGF